jgi:hypothetical protein
MSLRKSNPSKHEFFHGRHRFEHWYRDNSVYFITARCRDRHPAFASEQAKLIFFDRFDHYTQLHGYVPIVESLIDNHYHSLGYVLDASELGEMMRKLHGSVAKLVNDLLPERRIPFWRGGANDDYFDGCLRNPTQFRRTYRYVLLQGVRHGIVRDYQEYPYTRVHVELERALNRAIQLHAFPEQIPYPRYGQR